MAEPVSEGKLQPGHKQAQLTASETEVKRLQSEVKRLEMEVAIFKKPPHTLRGK
jgi:hypothetical protein